MPSSQSHYRIIELVCARNHLRQSSELARHCNVVLSSATDSTEFTYLCEIGQITQNCEMRYFMKASAGPFDPATADDTKLFFDCTFSSVLRMSRCAECVSFWMIWDGRHTWIKCKRIWTSLHSRHVRWVTGSPICWCWWTGAILLRIRIPSIGSGHLLERRWVHVWIKQRRPVSDRLAQVNRNLALHPSSWPKSLTMVFVFARVLAIRKALQS